MRLVEFKDAWDVVVATPKLKSRHIEAKNLSYKDAKHKLNELVGEYQSDVFPEMPTASVDWTPNGEGAKMSIPDTGAVIFFYMVDKSKAQ